MRRALLAAALLLASCGPRDSGGVKAIVGARLGDIPFSVIVVEGAKFSAAGPQASTPVPKDAEITSGLGMTAEPAGTPIAPGQPANLVLRGTGRDRTLRAGQWVQ